MLELLLNSGNLGLGNSRFILSFPFLLQKIATAGPPPTTQHSSSTVDRLLTEGAEEVVGVKANRKEKIGIWFYFLFTFPGLLVLSSQSILINNSVATFLVLQFTIFFLFLGTFQRQQIHECKGLDFLGKS